MSRARLKQLAAQLDRELARTDDIDPETRALLKKLDADLDELSTGDETSVADNARQLESRFAAEHPTAERLAREIADLLGKMGI